MMKGNPGRPEPTRAHRDTATKCNPMERGAGTPRELAAETAALRSAGILACEFWQRPAASLVAVSRCAQPTRGWISLTPPLLPPSVCRDDKCLCLGTARISLSANSVWKLPYQVDSSLMKRWPNCVFVGTSPLIEVRSSSLVFRRITSASARKQISADKTN